MQNDDPAMEIAEEEDKDENEKEKQLQSRHAVLVLKNEGAYIYAE